LERRAALYLETLGKKKIKRRKKGSFNLGRTKEKEQKK